MDGVVAESCECVASHVASQGDRNANRPIHQTPQVLQQQTYQQATKGAEGVAALIDRTADLSKSMDKSLQLSVSKGFSVSPPLKHTPTHPTNTCIYTSTNTLPPSCSPHTSMTTTGQHRLPPGPGSRGPRRFSGAAAAAGRGGRGAVGGAGAGRGGAGGAAGAVRGVSGGSLWVAAAFINGRVFS
jgi:hypothetical protein